MDSNKDKPPVSPQVRAYMSRLGKRASAINKQKGSEYFKWVRSHGKQKAKKEESHVTPTESDSSSTDIR